MKLFGKDAAMKSALRADALLDQGDVDGFHAWKRIAAATTELLRDAPLSGEPIH